MNNDAAAVRALLDGEPDVVVPVPGTDRVVAADVDGDPGGVPVMYVHGTPDSRLARHPDPSIVAELGVRLVAVDRPGFGHSTPDAAATPASFAADLTALLDHLGIPSAHLLAWSAGAIWTLGAAPRLGDRARSVTVVGGLAPADAFDDPVVRAAAGPTRLGMVDTAQEMGAEMAAELIAPMLVPDPPTPEAALEHRGEAGDDDLAIVAGAEVRMAAAACDAVRHGTAGLIRDVTVQLGHRGVPFDGVRAPARFITGAEDHTCPPAFAHWFADRIPGSTTRIVAGAAHGLLLTHWRAILAEILED